MTFACALGSFLALLALMLAADVFGLFGTRLAVTPVAQNLRLTTNGDRVIKALQMARREEPLDILFLGSSRVVFAFDPAAPTLAGMRAFNAGLNGSHSDEARIVLHYAIDHGPPIARIVWNVDFEEFFRETEGPADFPQSAFAGASPLDGLLRHTLTYEALRKSLAAFFGGQSFFADMNGFYDYARRPGANLDSDHDTSAVPTLRDWFPNYLVDAEDRFASIGMQRFARIGEAIRYARAHGVAVDVIAMPTHVGRRALYDLAGLEPRFELWKRRLAETVVAAAEGDGAPARVLDFSEVSEISRTVFRPAGPLDRSPWFFELLHPKPVVGEMIVARLLDRPSPLPADPGFGDSMEKTAQPARLEADRAALARWEAENPEIIRAIAEILRANDHRPERLANQHASEQ